jgi:hypothetical protein
MDLKNRKRVIFWVRLGLIFGTVVFILSWVGGRVGEKIDAISVETQAPASASLNPGDVQIITTDGNFDLTLQGDKILAGLSEKMVAKVRDDIAKETDKAQSGLGAVIAGAVKSGVASAIGMHVSYALANVKEIRFRDGRIILVTMDGDTHALAGDSKDANTSDKAVFAEADAQRFMEAVSARKKELGLP